MISFFHTVQSFSQFLWNWLLSGGQLVDQNTANLRAQICVGCHNNIPSGDVTKGACSSCNKVGNAFLNNIRNTIIKGNSTPSNGQLLACGICGCDLKISVWIPNVALIPIEHVNAYPDFCWKKKRLVNMDL